MGTSVGANERQLCIEQSNKQHKEEQIAIMSLIYRGAWATLIALDGETANAGLGRVNAGSRVSDARYAQTGYRAGKTELLTIMPTLQQLCNRSRWAKRAWTLQECTLSPRYLYFTPYQVYFECNATQLCESVNESGSWFHEQLS